MTDDTDLRYFRDIYELCEFLKIPNDWFSLPGAEALIPLNPSRWPAHFAGSVLSQESKTPDALGLLGKPFDNIKTVPIYLRRI